jgi:hypothetical protein
MGEAFLTAFFKNDPAERAPLNGRLTEAVPAKLSQDQDALLCTFVLRKEVPWPEADVSDEPWLWWNAKRLTETETKMNLRVPSLDLLARSVAHLTPNVFSDIAVPDHVYVAREPDFADALAIRRFVGEPTLSTRSDIERVESVLDSPEFACGCSWQRSRRPACYGDRALLHGASQRGGRVNERASLHPCCTPCALPQPSNRAAV